MLNRQLATSSFPTKQDAKQPLASSWRSCSFWRRTLESCVLTTGSANRLIAASSKLVHLDQDPWHSMAWMQLVNVNVNSSENHALW
jgi:hypothetical protein